MRIAIHQPNLLPRLKVLQKLASADVWCVLDSVQFCDRELQNRARMVAVHGDNHAFWLSIPVHRPHGRDTLLSEIDVVNPASTAWLVERTLLHAFRRAPYWSVIDELIASLEPSLTAGTLVRICVESTSSLLRIAGRQPILLFASSLPVVGKASELMAAICGYLNATTYLADSGAQNYLQPAPFAGVEVLWQNWREPTEKWPGISSWRDLSSVNYLARVGPDQFARHVISGEFTPHPTWGPCITEPGGA